MRFGSVCSGIEAASVAFEPLGWRAAWFAEIEPFPRAVLAHHYPDVPNVGDMTTIPALLDAGAIDAPDILCGGTPCQAFSVAGLRRSLDDARGNLSLTFCEIADAIDRHRSGAGDEPCVVFWENVPGVLNTKDNAFGCFLAGLAGEDDPLEPPGGKWTNAGAVFGPARAVAWRVLDAQYFGVAQRRRRVFVVASARDGFDPAAVLLEFDGVRRDLAPRREAGEAAAGGAGQSTAFGGNRTSGAIDVTPALLAQPGSGWKGDFESETFIAFSSKDHGADATADLAPTLRAMGHGDSHANGGGQVAIAFNWNAQAAQLPHDGRDYTINDGLTCSQQGAVAAAMQVRRLTPTEAERLQGFPDGYTAIPWRGKPASGCPDGPRYKALGNSWAVPCVRWIGERIDRMLRIC